MCYDCSFLKINQYTCYIQKLGATLHPIYKKRRDSAGKTIQK